MNVKFRLTAEKMEDMQPFNYTVTVGTLIVAGGASVALGSG